MKLLWQIPAARLRFALWATAVFVTPCGVTSPGPAPARVFLITVDTLRADHLGCMGYPRDVSPFLDRLAAGGALFTRAYASSSTTIACHTSLFTSLEPPQHRMTRNGIDEMHPSLFTMAEMFRARGYETAGFSTVDFLASVARGFDFFSTEKRYYPAEHVVGKAIRWLAGKSPAERLFVWVHLFDVHEWYRPQHVDEAYLARARQLPPAGAALVPYLRREQGLVPGNFGSDEAMIDAVDRYDGQILAVDAMIERLHSFVAAEGLGSDALWIVTADHGEGLSSHGFKGHGAKIYNEQLRVPLIFHFADGRFRGLKLDRVVRHVDVLPTLAEMLDTTLDQQVVPVVGQSLLPLLSGRRLPVRYAFAQRREADGGRIRGGWEKGDVFSIQSQDYKYIYHSRGDDELYDLRRDPLESENLTGVRTDVEKRMRDEAVHIHNAMSAQGEALGGGEINPEYVETLKALGYL
jgi:arylsulfatase A-like enzyme